MQGVVHRECPKLFIVIALPFQNFARPQRQEFILSFRFFLFLVTVVRFIIPRTRTLFGYFPFYNLLCEFSLFEKEKFSAAVAVQLCVNFGFSAREDELSCGTVQHKRVFLRRGTLKV